MKAINGFVLLSASVAYFGGSGVVDPVAAPMIAAAHGLYVQGFSPLGNGLKLPDHMPSIAFENLADLRASCASGSASTDRLRE